MKRVSQIRRGACAALLLTVFAASAFAAAPVVRGRVVDGATGAPIAGADVALQNESGGQGFFRARTGKDGTFEFKGVRTERYYGLEVGREGYADYVLSGWRFPEVQTGAEFVVPLDRAGNLEVRVTGADGRTPVANAKVQVRRERSMRWWEAWRPDRDASFTGADGAVRFADLAAGAYDVSIEALNLVSFEGRAVQVRRGETTPLAVKLTRPASLAGVVRLADGTGVPGLGVVARGAGEGVGATGDDGGFTIGDLAPGKYRLSLSHEGFLPLTSKEEWTLAEGDAKSGAVLVATPRAPELAFVLQREAFPPGTPVKIGQRSFRIGRVDYTLFRVPESRLVDPNASLPALAAARDTAGLARVDAWSRDTAEGSEWAWRDEEFALPLELEPGCYVLRGRAGSLERRTLFFITDVGLLVKRSATKLVVSAASLKTGTPLGGVIVAALPNATPSSGAEGTEWSRFVRGGAEGSRTDGRGLATLAIPASARTVRLVAYGAVSGVSVVEVPLSGDAAIAPNRVFAYTDRPIYRPGQTVYWKAFARKEAGAGWALPDATHASVEVSGPDAASLGADGRTLSAHGSADGAVEIPMDAPLGDWSLTVRANGASGTANFAVQEYRKPEFEVVVTPDREVAVNGDEVRFTVAASYFFGAPVLGARVRYNLFETRLADDANEYGESSGGYGRVLKTGEARTDADGRLVLSFTPERAAWDRRLTLEAEVADPANRVVSGRGGVVMGRGLFAIRLSPQSRVLDAGAPVRVEVTTRDHTGKPVAAAVTVTLDQEAWNPLLRRYTRSSRPLATTQITTNAAGAAVASLASQVARSGWMTLRARATDARGNDITAESGVWVWDARVSEYAYRYPTLEAIPDRERYAPGDTVKIVVNSEVRNGEVLATLEGRELYETKLVRLSGGTGLVTFALAAEHAPNVFVGLHVRKGKEVHSRVLELPVAAERRDLKIALETDREKYRPGETGVIRVRTSDAKGAPVPAEVSVGVVDESIYALKADDTPDPHDVFYGRRPNGVTTVVSFPLLYYGGASKDGQPDVRKDFRDVALWKPVVATGADGRAEVSVKFPDNLTTWRVTSRGLTDGTLVGAAKAKTLVTKDVVARIAAPRFLTAGDAARVKTVVTNRSGGALAGVEASFAAKGAARVAGAASAKLDLPANGEGAPEWNVEASKAPELDAHGTAGATFTFAAKSKADTDALESRVPVRPRAVAVRANGGGSVEGSTTSAVANENVALPGDLLRNGGEVTIEIAPSIAALALQAANWNLDYPYGCTEQTANAILPAVALLEAAKQAGVTPPGWEKPQDKLAPYLARLVKLRTNEGGWSWWNGGSPDVYLTSLAIDALTRASIAGVTGPDARSSLSMALNDAARLVDEARTEDGQAYVLAHLAIVKQHEFGSGVGQTLVASLESLADRVYAARANLSPGGLALATRGLALLGRPANARTCFELLMSKGVKEGPTLHWSDRVDEEAAWWGDDVETTADALTAMMAVAPADGRAGEIVMWLSRERRGGYWRSTRVTAPAAVALAAWLAAHPAGAAPSGRLAVSWNGASLLDRALDASDAWDASRLTLRVPAEAVKAGANALALRREGAGTTYYAWRAKSLVPSPGPEAHDARVSVTREYLRAERTTDRRGRPQWLVTPKPAGEPFRIGESVMVRLTLKAAKAIRHVLVEDPRIAGIEIEQLLPEGAEWPWGTHAEERDDRVALFVDALDEGETVIEYLVRPEIGGTFAALPATVSGFYDETLAARSGEMTVSVVGR